MTVKPLIHAINKITNKIVHMLIIPPRRGWSVRGLEMNGEAGQLLEVVFDVRAMLASADWGRIKNHGYLTDSTTYRPTSVSRLADRVRKHHRQEENFVSWLLNSQERHAQCANYTGSP
jgi:hypothetical protein